PDHTAALLEDLLGQRGVRQPVDDLDGDDEEFEGFGPPHAFGPATGRPGGGYETPALPGLEDLGAGPGEVDRLSVGAPDALPPAHPAGSHPGDRPDTTVLPLPRGAGTQDPDGVPAEAAPSDGGDAGEETTVRRARPRSRKG